MTTFYENETAKKQMNDLGLFDFFKSKNIITTKGSHVYFDPFYLSTKDANEKTCGYGACTLSLTRLALNFPELREKLLQK